MKESTPITQATPAITSQFSGVTIIIFIALGVLVFILLFIFAKRQIMRFALRSRRGPHVPVGHDAPRWLRKEIERRLDSIARIKYEPKLLCDGYTPPSQMTGNRMWVLDKLKDLERKLKAINPKLVRAPGDSIRHFLTGTALKNTNMNYVHRFCDIYDKARHSPDDVTERDVQEYEMLMTSIIDTARVSQYNEQNCEHDLVSTSKKKSDKRTSLLLPVKSN